MLLHKKTQKGQTQSSIIAQNEANPIFIHESKLNYSLKANQKEWALDVTYFQSVYDQLFSLATKGNMKNSPRKNELKSQLFKMETLIKDETECLIERLDALMHEFKSSNAPKLGTIFQEYAELEEEFQLLRNDFRRLTVDMLGEINRICPVKIY